MDKNSIFLNLKLSLQALSQPAEIQLKLFPEFVVKADELALDFSHWSEVAISNYGNELTKNQINILKKIDLILNNISGQENKEYWTDEALFNKNIWEEIRNISKKALSVFNWPIEIPPRDRGSVYIKSKK